MIKWSMALIFVKGDLVLHSRCGRFSLTQRTDGWTLADHKDGSVLRAQHAITLKSIAELRVGCLSIVKSEPMREA